MEVERTYAAVLRYEKGEKLSAHEMQLVTAFYELKDAWLSDEDLATMMMTVEDFDKVYNPHKEEVQATCSRQPGPNISKKPPSTTTGSASS